jgi:hypothetical protein
MMPGNKEVGMNRRLFLTIGVVAVAVGLSAPVKGFGNPQRTTFLTFNTPVALPGVALPAGTYIFERVNAASTLDVVRVMSRDRSKVYLTQLTIGTERPRGLARDRQILFAEVKRGETPRIAAWYPVESDRGHVFRY